MKTKIKVANLKKVNFALLRKEILRISTDMKTAEIPGGDAPETAIPFFVKKNHTFSCGKEHPLIVFAAKNPAWKKQAKEAFKEDKKGMFYGNCYIKEDTLFLQIQKGNMKIVDLKKAAKMLFKKAGIMNVGICQGASKEDKKSTTNNAQQQKTEMETDNPKLEARKRKGRQTMDKMLKNLENLAKKLKL